MGSKRTIFIIGAGPAGSMAAILLARAGVHVTLIEQSRFPRDKVCGECLSALGRSVLQRHDLETPLRNAGGIELTHTQLIAPDAQVRLDLPQPMLGISRAVLDQHLLNEACRAGAKLLQPWRAEGVEPSPTRLRIRNLIDNTISDHDTDCILIADGRGAFMGDRPPSTGDLGIKAHFRHIDADPSAITLYAADGCYAGAAPIEGDRWNVACSVPAYLMKRAKGDIQAVFQSMIHSNPQMQRHFAHAARTGEWLAAPLPRFSVRNHWPTNVIPLGNAAAAIEPIGGEGMGLALRSAELAAEAILADRTATLPQTYRSLWQKRGLFCRLSAWLLSRPMSANTSIDLLQSTPLPRRAMLSLIGK